MTSIPASRRARAMIFAPRSCPSRPGLAITTRIFLATAAQVYGGETDRRRLLPRMAEPRRRAVGIRRRGRGRARAARLRAGCARAVAGGRASLAADRRNRDHALPPRPL